MCIPGTCAPLPVIKFIFGAKLDIVSLNDPDRTVRWVYVYSWHWAPFHWVHLGKVFFSKTKWSCVLQVNLAVGRAFFPSALWRFYRSQVSLRIALKCLIIKNFLWSITSSVFLLYCEWNKICWFVESWHSNDWVLYWDLLLVKWLCSVMRFFSDKWLSSELLLFIKWLCSVLRFVIS